MRLITATLALGLCLLGCGSKAPPGEPVQLLTGVMPFDADECPRDSYVASQLLVDVQYGTALAGYYGGETVPIMWPPDFTGQRFGSVLVVVDPNGKFIARTGESYSIQGNRLYPADSNDHETYRRGVVISPIGEFMLYACGPVRPEPTGHPPGEQCGLSFPCSTRPTSP